MNGMSGGRNTRAAGIRNMIGTTTTTTSIRELFAELDESRKVCSRTQTVFPHLASQCCLGKAPTMVRSILIVDDNAYIRKALCDMFKREEDFDICGAAENGRD